VGSTTTPCPTDTFSPAGATLASQCVCQGDATNIAGTGCRCNAGFQKVAKSAGLLLLGDRECIACPANSYCASDATTPCPSNSQSPASSSLISHCVCNGGYQRISDSCTTCPAGWYCSNNAKLQCPANTDSLQLSSMQAHCKCNAGYQCKRVRSNLVTIKFSLTQANYDSNKASIRTKLASILQVLESDITYVSSAVSASRRLLSAGEDEANPMLEISAHIAVQAGSDLSALFKA
jgi:hypothetical protein